jgi:hypothetical protein
MWTATILVKIAKLFYRLSKENYRKAEEYAEISRKLINNNYFYLSVLFARYHIIMGTIFYKIGGRVAGLLRWLHHLLLRR